MQTTTITRSAFLFDGPRVVEQSRGTAHPAVRTARPLHAGSRSRRPLLTRAARR